MIVIRNSSIVNALALAGLGFIAYKTWEWLKKDAKKRAEERRKEEERINRLREHRRRALATVDEEELTRNASLNNTKIDNFDDRAVLKEMIEKKRIAYYSNYISEFEFNIRFKEFRDMCNRFVTQDQNATLAEISYYKKKQEEIRREEEERKEEARQRRMEQLEREKINKMRNTALDVAVMAFNREGGVVI